MDEQHKSHWNLLEKCFKPQLLQWAKSNGICITELGTISMFAKSAEIYIFYPLDEDIEKNNIDGVTERVKAQCKIILTGMDYFKTYPEDLRFFIASEETVNRSFDGNYLSYMR